MMEIETSKDNLIPIGKRNHKQLLDHFKNDLNAKTRKVKLSIKNKPTYHLSYLEKSFVYLYNAIGTEEKEIASSINRDPRSIKSFIQTTNTETNVFSPKILRKEDGQKVAQS